MPVAKRVPKSHQADDPDAPKDCPQCKRPGLTNNDFSMRGDLFRKHICKACASENFAKTWAKKRAKKEKKSEVAA